MKKLILFLLVLVTCVNGYAALDTTIVSPFQDVTIRTSPTTGSNTYTKWVSFPAASQQYRKVVAQLKFECASGQKCGEADNMDNILIGRKGGVATSPVNFEIVRLVTPKGGLWTSANGWNHTWYVDVTDFAVLLHDSVEILYKHNGYEDSIDRGWKISLNFICVKGMPVAEPISVSRLWNGEFMMGYVGDPIENHLSAVPVTLNAQTNFVRIKGMHTGDGSDNTGCMQFCRKYRDLLWDGTPVNRKQIWRSDCGLNAVYPQTGNWLFDRGGWCPGSTVRYDDNTITGTGGGSSHTVDMDMEQYTANNNYGTLNTTMYLVEYKSPNNSVDVAIQDVIAPSSDPDNKRYNPICNDPIVVIRNNGSSMLTNATIEYGVQGGTMSTFNWSGQLGFMQTDTVTLTNPVAWTASSGKFVISVKNPNGQQDPFEDDNTMVTNFETPPVLPNKIVIYLMTNKDARENYYKLVNATTHQQIYFKKGLKNETLYQDTINISPNNCYYFYFSDEDSSASSTHYNKDGLDFDVFNSTEGVGVLKIKNGNTGSVVKDITQISGGPFGTKGGDYGTRYAMYFTSVFALGTSQVTQQKSEVNIYPNPAGDIINLDYITKENNASVYIADMQGKIVYHNNLKNSWGTETINSSSFSPGIYIVRFVSGDETIVKKLVKQ